MYRIRVDHNKYTKSGTICANVDPVQSYEMSGTKDDDNLRLEREVESGLSQTTTRDSSRTKHFIKGHSSKAKTEKELSEKTLDNLLEGKRQASNSTTEIPKTSSEISNSAKTRNSGKVEVDWKEKGLLVTHLSAGKPNRNESKQRSSPTESKESGIQDDIDESIDDFIEELEALETSLDPRYQESGKSSQNSDVMHNLLERMKTSLDQETESSKEFLTSVRTWKCSSEIQQAMKLTPDYAERYRQEWFQNRFSRQRSEEKKSTVSERLQRRKEKLRTKQRDN